MKSTCQPAVDGPASNAFFARMAAPASVMDGRGAPPSAAQVFGYGIRITPNGIPAKPREVKEMARDQLLRIKAPARLHVLSGSIWITEEGNPSDYFIEAAGLNAPAVYLLENGREAILSALEDSVLEVG